MEIDESLDDILDTDKKSTYKGPVPNTLQALCILTFVGSAVILLIGYIVFQILEGDSDITLAFTVRIISCLGSVLGAILMLLLKRSGFYIYLVSNIFYFLGTFWLWFGIIGWGLDEWLLIVIFANIAVPVGFTILYSTQKKYLH